MVKEVNQYTEGYSMMKISHEDIVKLDVYRWQILDQILMDHNFSLLLKNASILMENMLYADKSLMVWTS